MTPAEALKVLSVLRNAFPREVLTPETVTVYCAELADIDYELAGRAARKIIRSSEWFPTIAKIRVEVDALAKTLAKNPPIPALPAAPVTKSFFDSIRGTLAHMFATNAPPKKRQPAVVNGDRVIDEPPTADPEEERAMIERTIARARESGDRS